ncbi:MAG: heme o synthase [Pseudomonadales bacterium]
MSSQTELKESPSEFQLVWRDYLQLCKPKVVALMLLCATVGMFLATTSGVSLSLLIWTNLGIALVAGSAACVNHLVDAKVDAQMSRTARRPIAEGRISVNSAILFSAVTGITGLAILTLFVNPLTAWLNLASWVGYGIIYSMYLKHATPQNIVIGGVFGAAPPLFGWTAVTNQIEPGAVLLLMIIFTWTPPHFWALALDRKDEYAKVDIPMLPVTHGEQTTKRYIFAYTILLMIVSALPFAIGMSGLFYLITSTGLGLVFLYHSAQLLASRPHAAIKTFRYSIVYLMALFMVLLVDHFMFLIS